VCCNVCCCVCCSVCCNTVGCNVAGVLQCVLQCVAVCCKTYATCQERRQRCVAVYRSACCSELQCVAVRCNNTPAQPAKKGGSDVLQCVAKPMQPARKEGSDVLQCIAVRVAVSCSVLQCAATTHLHSLPRKEAAMCCSVCCSVLQCITVRCNNTPAQPATKEGSVCCSVCCSACCKVCCSATTHLRSLPRKKTPCPTRTKRSS